MNSSHVTTSLDLCAVPTDQREAREAIQLSAYVQIAGLARNLACDDTVGAVQRVALRRIAAPADAGLSALGDSVEDCLELDRVVGRVPTELQS